MKITIIGGGSVRMPLVANAFLKWYDRIPIDELVFMDNDQERLDLIGMAVRGVLNPQNPPFKMRWTTDAVDAIKDSDFIIFTIRVGNEEARAKDERIALQNGLLGQETVGPGGLAMALRTIPVLLDYAEMINKYAPNAWVVNFTNPAGMVTQALTKYSKLKRIVGICDEYWNLTQRISQLINVPPLDLYLDYVGINHMGWVKKVIVNGEDWMPKILSGFNPSDSDILEMPFEGYLIQTLKLIPQEYLHFYYTNKEVVENIVNSEESRAEQILRLTPQLFEDLRNAKNHQSNQEAWEAIVNYNIRRVQSYFATESGAAQERTREWAEDLLFKQQGYEGVALAFIAACIKGTPSNPIALQVPNNGAVAGFQNDDVMEIPSIVHHGIVSPLTQGEAPEMVNGLMMQAKVHERLGAEASVTGNYETALKALMVHPVVHSYRLAKKILDEYLIAHKEYLPQFQNKIN